jgi:dynactin-4
MRLVAAAFIPTITVRPMPTTTTTTTITASSTPTSPANTILRPLRPTQFILKFRNPIFEKVRVKLATPRKTPGRWPAEVTLLCHEFHIDANTDMWEDAQDALKQQQQQQGQGPTHNRHDDAALQQGGMDKYEVPFERARNWVSIVVEVKPDVPSADVPKNGGDDDAVLEIPIYVRLEWEAETQGDLGANLDKDGRETRGLEYWCVVGVGRVVQD